MNDGQHHEGEYRAGSRSWKHLPRVLPYLRRYKGLVGSSGGLLFVGVAISLLEPWPMAFLVDSVLGSHRPTGPAARYFGTDRHTLIVVAACFGFVLALASNGLHVFNEFVNTKLDQRLRLDFRRDLFERAQQLSLTYHDTHRAGYFAQNINTHTTSLGQMVVDIPPLLQSVLTLIGMFVIAYLLDPLLAILALGVMPFIYYSTIYYTRHIEPRLIRTRDEEGLSLSVVHEAMQMLRVILAFRREKHELKRFSDQAEHAINLRVDITIKQTLFSLAVNITTAAGTALVLGFGASHVLSHELSVGELLVMMGYIASVYQPLQTISSTMSAWQEHLVDFWLALELLDQEPEIVERPDALRLERLNGRVTFEQASFSYPKRLETLSDVTFDVPPGSVVAVVGPTGAGKTTLTNLIPRFYEASSGRVMVDGHDVRDLSLDSLRLNVAMVQQEPMLFLATIAENIRYGRLDATMEEIEEAAQQANAHDFISALPDQYETKLGERGSMLSGGERQRLCIARAFLKDAPILILDEPTSSIDTRTEGVILDALGRLMVGRTTFIVAHRLSTIGRATAILVLDKGRLVEQGTHDDLVDIDGGLYRQLWLAQSSGGRPPALPPAVTPASLQPPVEPAAAPATAATTTPAPVVSLSPSPGGPAIVGRPKAVVLGMMSKMPVAGVVWQTVHYLMGLERLGFDAYYVEAHARTPSMLMARDDDDSSALAAAFIKRVMERFGLNHRWAFHALHDDGRCLGLTEGELARLYQDATIIFNLHGGTQPRPEHSATGRLVYVESDPCQLQIELFEGQQKTIEFLEPHVAFFTFGENIGQPDCTLPEPTRFAFTPTRQPVLVDLWEARGIPAGPAFTTVANWRQPWRDVHLGGETYHWSKHHEFLKFLDLPEVSGAEFELALSSYGDADQELLERRGWSVRPGLEVSRSIDTYRSFVAGSMGEFTVAKDQNVRFRSGWFSDRSASYLAAGRPVVTQDTGFGSVLPTGEGLFAFRDLEEAVEAVDEIRSNYARHSRAAHDIAREHFDAEVVLGDMLDHLDLRVTRRGRPRAAPIPDDLVLTPDSRRPLVLPEMTRARVLARAVGTEAVTGGPSAEPIDGPTDGPPMASVVVVTHNNLVCTRLCVESILGAGGPPVELLVVDNCSTDGTPAYLERLAEADSRVRVLANVENVGFAGAVNQGLEVAAADVLVISNNDTIVAPGWLEGLVAHLVDPTVGAVGPVTGRIGNQAEIDADNKTYGELIEFVADRASRWARRSVEVPMLAFFCTAMRRDVYEAVGPLDEQFGIGLFEDDDYAERMRRAGYRLVCAEDVYVHHIGEASFGGLVPTGEYAELFEANRLLFEAKWDVTWQGHERRTNSVYEAAVGRTAAAVERVLPGDAHVLVVSRGDARLLELTRHCGHFPQDSGGGWAGHNPGTSAEAVQELVRLQASGASHLLVPSSARWWLSHYKGFAEHLAAHATVVVDDEDCTVFDLGSVASTEATHGVALVDSRENEASLARATP